MNSPSITSTDLPSAGIDTELEPEFLARLLVLANLADRRHQPNHTAEGEPVNAVPAARATIAGLTADYVKLVAETQAIATPKHLITLQQRVLRCVVGRPEIALAISTICWEQILAARLEARDECD